MTLSIAEAPIIYGPLPAAPPLIVTYEEAARILGGGRPVSTRHIERLVLARELRRVGRSKARRIVYDSILEYVRRAG